MAASGRGSGCLGLLAAVTCTTRPHLTSDGLRHSECADFLLSINLCKGDNRTATPTDLIVSSPSSQRS